MTAESFIARRRQERLEELTRENVSLRRENEVLERRLAQVFAELDAVSDRWTR
jgi:regulator of replication initiation timing